MNDISTSNSSVIVHTVPDLATQLGSTVEHLWGVALHQATVDGIISLFSILLFAVILIGWTFVMLKNTADGGMWDDEVGKLMLKLFTGLAWVFFVIQVCTSLPMLYASFFNPDFWVMKQLLPHGAS